MELSFREKTIKYGVYALVILAAALLQNINGAWFSIFGARCFFLVPVCVLVGIGEDERFSALFGLFGGILWDMISSRHRLFASIFLMLVCYIISALVNFLFRNTFLFGIIAGAVASLFFCILYWLFFVLIGGDDGSLSALGTFYIPSAVYTAFMTPLLYLLIRPLKSRLNKKSMA